MTMSDPEYKSEGDGEGCSVALVLGAAFGCLIVILLSSLVTHDHETSPPVPTQIAALPGATLTRNAPPGVHPLFLE
jgi:hypothetical protein